MREAENIFKSVPGSSQRRLSIDDGGQAGSASWISIRSESMLHHIDSRFFAFVFSAGLYSCS